MNKISYSLIASTLLFSQLSADDNIVKAHLELSYMNSSGNSETETFSMKSDFSKKFDDTKSIKGKANGSFVTDKNSKTDDNEIANKLYIEGEYDHKVSTDFFAFIKTDYTADKFSGFEYKVNVGPGLGYKVPFKAKGHSLDLSLSIAYSQDKEQKENSNSINYSSGNLGIKYVWEINKLWKFKQDLSGHQDFENSENYSAKSSTALEHKLTSLGIDKLGVVGEVLKPLEKSSVSLGVSYTINYQNNAPKKDVDRLFLTSIIIDY